MRWMILLAFRTIYHYFCKPSNLTFEITTLLLNLMFIYIDKLSVLKIETQKTRILF